MKKVFAVMLLSVVTVGAAEENFSKAVRTEDFSAAGLSKLTPEELARLDALVRDFNSGSLAKANDELAGKLAAAKRSAELAEQARVDAEAKAAKAEATVKAQTESVAAAAKEKLKSDGGLLAKAKVLLSPGTEVEYAAVESRIAGDFTGWEGRPIFTLENGQRWQIANGGSYSTPPIASPKVKIVPASLGGFWMTIEGVSQRVRVTPLGGGK